MSLSPGWSVQVVRGCSSRPAAGRLPPVARPSQASAAPPITTPEVTGMTSTDAIANSQADR
ncbi:MAG: hypothetical protein R8G01_16210 [Ilumatobacteraceae bacterium]|nr:hypothetical protein [Ilumatobacteraceae bacterium]